MRYDRRFTRVRDLITHESIPRFTNGGIALCHLHQRSVMFSGGFLEHLTNMLERPYKYDPTTPL